MLTALFGRFEAWHGSRFVRPWFGPMPLTRGLVLAALTLAVVVGFANVKVRYDQGQIWKAHPEVTEISGALSFSTADAPYFLGHAAVAKAGLPTSEYERKRVFPTGENLYSDEKFNGLEKTRPLLSTWIGWLAETSDPADLLKAGHKILFLTTFLTCVMIVFCLCTTGFLLESSVAGLGGCLSAAYLVRSSFGRIDTDQLNLGLLYLIFGLITLSSRANSTVKKLIWCVMAGLTSKLLLLWYDREELVWLAFGSYFLLLLTSKTNFKIKALCIFLIYLICPLEIPRIFESKYFANEFVGGGLIFPNPLTTITETVPIRFGDSLQLACGSLEMGILCILGLLLWSLRHPRMGLAYLPLSSFFLLSPFLGSRAVFYSAPMLWFGAAFALTTIARFIAYSKNRSGSASMMNVVSSWHCIFATGLALLMVWFNSPTNYVPQPSFPTKVMNGFIVLKELARNEKAVVASWWDYGYASIFFNGLPTLHDGGSQIGPTTHFVAKSLLASSQSETVEILQFISKFQNNEITYTNQPAKYKQEKFQQKNIPFIYLVLTDQLGKWMKSISTIANWNLQAGEPIVLQNNDGEAFVEYKSLGCNYRGFPSSIVCGRLRFDFDQGLINNTPDIASWTRARDGFTQDVRRYNDHAPFVMQTLLINNRLTSQLMHRQLYDSSYNKLFHLGLVEAPGVALVYDDYPHIRIYKIAGQE